MQLPKTEHAALFDGSLCATGATVSWKNFAFRLFITVQIFFAAQFSARGEPVITDENPLALPSVGAHGLRILSPTVLELTLIGSKQADPAVPSVWNFVNGDQSLSLPGLASFVVKADGVVLPVTQIGFKRRPIYAPEKPRDLRIANHLYLMLAVGVAEGQEVEVFNPLMNLWREQRFTATMEPMRYSPAIHVNQAGYMPGLPKKAQVGYYLGSLGELHVPAGSSYSLVETSSGEVVFQGTLRARLDEGFNSTPKPYQKVLEADFSSFSTPGEYQLKVPGAGASLPFRIDDGVAAYFARTFALGLVNQRCGHANSLPFTRHEHGVCHSAPAEVPTMDPAFAKTQEFLGNVSGDFADEPRHTARQLKDVASSLYPFVRQGQIDVAGGHHDAGDYSKYTINSAGLTHFLVFAADSFAGAGLLDNLGIPESGDAKSDLLQEAKWEADFLAKMQDSDGGFYFLVYPKNRRYENNVLPENGDAQVVWPKNTAVTAASVAALAETGSSPLFKAQFPAEAAVYLQKAKLGWNFLMDAVDFIGKDASYQKMTHYGNEFMHDDELAWAAAALYAATGEAHYQTKLFEYLPDPNAVSTRRWTWWRLFEGYGCAIRTYAFAARSGRLQASQLNASYLAKCEAEIIAGADDHVRFSGQSAYGTSFPDGNKQYRSAGWYFSSERAFDVTVAYQLRPRAEYVDAVVANYNYEGGSNPLNMTFVTGIGWKRQREVVSQHAWNDHRILPPAGLPLGNIQSGFGYLETYKSPVTGRSELTLLSYPPDIVDAGNYAFYDRWTDMINTTTEFVVMDQARSLASLAFWMARSSKQSQPWVPVTGQINGLDQIITSGEPVNLSLSAPGIDLSSAQVLWEVRHVEPQFGNPVKIKPEFSGDHWIEAEALLPDGRRIIAVSNFVAHAGVMPPNSYQSAPQSLTGDSVALYHLDDENEASGRQPDLVFNGNAGLDDHNLGWMANRNGKALRVLDLGDTATVTLPTSALRLAPATSGISVDAMIYVNEFKAFNRGAATLLSLEETWNSSLKLVEDKYVGPMAKGGSTFAVANQELKSALSLKTWHHVSLRLTRTGYTVSIDGRVIASAASGDLPNWGRSSVVKLTMGDFDGWIDEVSVRATGAPNAMLTPLRPNGEGGFRMKISGEAGKTYRVQASHDSTTWSEVGALTLTSESGEFVDMTIGPSYRFYRAVAQ